MFAKLSGLNTLRLLCMVVLAGAIAAPVNFVLVGTAHAQEENKPERKTRRVPSMSEAVYKRKGRQ